MYNADNFIVGPLSAKVISPITEEDDDEIKKQLDSPSITLSGPIPATEDVPVTSTMLTNERKSVTFEEDDKDGKKEITARQRWLWAFNKIIMQFNVSFSTSLILIRSQIKI